MAHDLSRKNLDETPEHGRSILISVAILVAMTISVYFAWNSSKEVPASQSPQIENHRSGSEKSIEGNALSKLPDTPTKFVDKFGQRDEDGYKLNLDGKTVSQYVKSLYDAANKGDLKAAFNIYRAESICSRSAYAQRMLNLMPVDTEKSILGNTKSYINDAQVVCADLNVNQKERLDYLRIAAKGGLAEAAIAFSGEQPEWIDVPAGMPLDQTDPNVVQWENDVVNYLTQAATQGNTRALGWLATVYEGDRLVPRDLQLALTYDLASAQILNQSPAANPVTASMLQNLSPDQVSAAKAAASALVNACCKHN